MSLSPKTCWFASADLRKVKIIGGPLRGKTGVFRGPPISKKRGGPGGISGESNSYVLSVWIDDKYHGIPNKWVVPVEK